MMSPARQSSAATELLFVLPSLGGGGAERVVTDVARHLHSRGHVIHVAAARVEGPLLHELPDDLPRHRLGGGRMAAALPPLVTLLRRLRPRAVLSTIDHANLVTIAAAGIAGARTRVVLRLANTTSVGLQGAGTGLRLALPWGIRFGYPRADALIAVSRGVAEDLSRLSRLDPSRFHVVHNPVDCDQIHRSATAPARHPWLDGREPVVLAAGRLEPQKDFVTLLRAFAAVRRSRRAKLVILGEGRERPALEALAAQLGVRDDVSLPGFIPRPYPEMARASVFCLSSRHEGFPNVLVEALACGTPVVSTDCPSGPSEILEPRHLVPVGDPDVLARALLARLKAPRRAADWVQMAEPFALRTIARRYAEIALGSGGAPAFEAGDGHVY